MYIDSLTIAAALLFLVAFAMFIRFCIFKTCGLGKRRDADNGASS